MKLDRILMASAAAAGIPCGSCAAYCGLLVWSGNQNMVASGQLCRSALLNGQEFGEEIEAHHIRTVHDDVGISTQELVGPEKIEQIPAVLRDTPKPVLVVV